MFLPMTEMHIDGYCIDCTLYLLPVDDHDMCRTNTTIMSILRKLWSSSFENDSYSYAYAMAEGKN